MGEYWKPINVTRREYIHPHRVNNGLKLPEWWGYDSATVRQMKAMWSEADDVRAVSDYDGEQQLWGEPDGPAPAYFEVEEHYRDVSRAASLPDGPRTEGGNTK